MEESLLTDEELSRSADFIKSLKDPFGDWNKLVQVNESQSEEANPIHSSIKLNKSGGGFQMEDEIYPKHYALKRCITQK